MSKVAKTYKELEIWKESIDLVKEIYQITSDFPDTEKFGLQSQIRRAAVSVPSNIAEGFSRESKKEFIKFLQISLGSLFEVDTQLIIAKDLGYLKNIQNEQEKIERIGKRTNALINKLKEKLNVAGI